MTSSRSEPSDALPAYVGHVAIWDFALEKCEGDKDRSARLVCDFYRAFWLGKFGTLKLVLAQDKHSEPGADYFDYYDRETLAMIALGTQEFSKHPIQEIYNWLSSWNIADYQKVRAGYRYYFVPDEGVGAYTSQRRGLLAPIEVLEKWVKSNAQYGDTYEFRGKTKSTRPSESFGGRRFNSQPALALATEAIRAIWPKGIPADLRVAEQDRLIIAWCKANAKGPPPSTRSIFTARAKLINP